MDIRGYEYKTNPGFLNYEFCSEGPKGKIKKVVRFTLRNANGITYFNLGFGDLDITGEHIDDLAISNNHDKDKVLATVAQIVLEFTARFPDLRIYAQGSTSSRTRLYQMGIGANWDKIDQYYMYMAILMADGKSSNKMLTMKHLWYYENNL